MRRSAALACATLLAIATGAPAEEEIYVDAGACPGEGCSYDETWVAREPIALLAAPAADAATVATLATGQAARTLTGEVHTRPGRFVVREAREGYAPGDAIELFTYLGEGFWRARRGSRELEIDLGFSPWDRGKCREPGDTRCWGTLERAARFDWWVKLRSADGDLGWALDSRAFEKPGPP